MWNSFKNILIPVDFTTNTEVAVMKGIELADNDCTIHLLHVQRNILVGSIESYQPAFSINSGRDHIDIEKKLGEWKMLIEDCFSAVHVCTWIAPGGSVQTAIEKRAKHLGVNLIIIGKQSHHSWFPFLNTVVPSKLARRSRISVLTVRPGAIRSRTKSVVVSVTDGLNSRKKEIIVSICSKFHVKIHLVTFNHDGKQMSESDAAKLLQFYQWLKFAADCSVEHVILSGEHKARSMLQFAKKIDADLLLVHPQTETRIGWRNSHISDVLPASSKLQVMSVQ